MSLLPKACGKTTVFDAQGTKQGDHRGSPPPALGCRIAKAGVLAESVLEKRSPRPYFPYFQRVKLLHMIQKKGAVFIFSQPLLMKKDRGLWGSTVL